MAAIKTITARIWWDEQDPNNEGWAWTTRVNGDHDDSGPLDIHGDLDSEPTDEELIEALRGELTEEAAESLSDDDIEIVR